MAYPVILFNNSTGSDTAASGAGPSTALSGTSASYSESGVGEPTKTFTLDGSPDLSGVITDGSHVIWVDTSEGRQFFKITAVDDGADTVEVDAELTGTTTGLTWGLGGKRASLKGSRMLFESEYGSWGSYGPGATYEWKAELADGYFETFGSGDVLKPNVEGESYSEGKFEIRAEAGATTRPRLEATHSGGVDATIIWGDYGLWGTYPRIKLTGIDFEYNNASTSSYVYMIYWDKHCDLDNCLFTKTAAGGCVAATLYNNARVRHCTFECGGASSRQSVLYCYRNPLIEDSIIRNGTYIGLSVQCFYYGTVVKRCQIYGNGLSGLCCCYGMYYHLHIVDCVINGNGADGIEIAGWSDQPQFSQVENCQITNNGGYGVNQDTWNDRWKAIHYRNNNFHGNTSGESNVTLTKFDCTASAPGYTDAGNGDFSSSQGNDLGAPIKPCGHDGATDASQWYNDIGVDKSSSGGGGGSPRLINGGLIS